MPKGKSANTPAKTLLQGLGVSLALYVLGQMILAALAIRGILPEQSLAAGVMVMVFLSAWCGSFFCASRLPWGALPAAMLHTAIFAFALVVAALLIWNQLTLAGQGSGVLISLLAGGIIAALCGGKVHPRRKKRRR